MTDPAPEISVVIPTFRRPDHAVRAVMSAVRQTLAPDLFEVVVAIDGHEPGTRAQLESLALPFRLVVLDGAHAGRARACNRGIAAARGRVVVLLDDDMVLTPGCLAAHLDAHRPGAARCLVAAAPVTLGPHAPPLARFMGDKFNAHLERLATPGHRVGLRDFYSGHCSAPREVLVRAGLYDERFDVYGNEDLELSLRLRRTGVDIGYLPHAVAEQTWDKSLTALARDTHDKGVTAVRLARIHPDAVSELALSQGGTRSRQWRVLRALLLALTRRSRRTERAVVAVVRGRERLGGTRPDAWYAFLLDYLYWAGAEQAGWRSTGAG